jgi:hypothetical protein
MQSANRIRVLTLPWLVALIPLGVATKFYTGPLRLWVANSLGGVLYEVFWCLAVLALMPRLRAPTIAGGVVVVTAILEIAQLWHPPWLQAIRATFLGAALLGTTFVWSDFAYYLLGGAAGWWAIALIRRESAPSSP